MRTTYYPDDDILVMRFSDQPIDREISQDWFVTISYDAAGSIVEIVVLDAKVNGLYPVKTGETEAA